MDLKIISWNIWYGKYMDKIVDYLGKENADVVCLQEVVADKNGTNNIAEAIAKKLGYEFLKCAFAIEVEKEGKTLNWGNAILSKFPVVDSKTHVLSEADRRIALQADIEVKSTTLHVFTTHLIHTHQKDSAVQNEQTDNLIKNLTRENTILTGDFNAMPESYAVKKLSAVLANAGRSDSPTWSVYPSGCAVCEPKGLEYRLDYIFVSSDVKVKNHEIGDSIGSDHLPISATVEI